MKLKRIKSLWGMEGSLEEQFKKIAEAGYVGIENPVPRQEQTSEFKELLIKYNFDYIAQIFADIILVLGNFDDKPHDKFANRGY
jgi:sugar phosphate isomerase/epimerase